jgi:hypothetical protein
MLPSSPARLLSPTPAMFDGANIGPADKVVRASYDYSARKSKELTVTKGEILVVINEKDTKWWKLRRTSGDVKQQGYVPRTYVQVFPRDRLPRGQSASPSPDSQPTSPSPAPTSLTAPDTATAAAASSSVTVTAAATTATPSDGDGALLHAKEVMRSPAVTIAPSIRTGQRFVFRICLFLCVSLLDLRRAKLKPAMNMSLIIIPCLITALGKRLVYLITSSAQKVEEFRAFFARYAIGVAQVNPYGFKTHGKDVESAATSLQSLAEQLLTHGDGQSFWYGVLACAVETYVSRTLFLPRSALSASRV